MHRFLTLTAAAAVLALTAGYASTVKAEPVFGFDGDLIAHWKFNEGSGTTATDSVGTNDGTIDGATYTGGGADAAPVAANPDALSFDGTNDEVVVGDDGVLDFEASDPFTIALWVKVDGSVDLSARVIHILGKRGGCGGGQMNYQFANDPTNEFHFNSKDGGIVSAGEDLPVGDWVHIAATYDGGGAGTGTLKLYINGVQKGIDTTYDIDDNNSSLKFGTSDNCPAGQRHKGILDDIRFYDVALTQPQVEELAAQQFTLEVVKQNVMGPFDLDGASLGGGLTTNTNDAGAILIGLSEPQRYKFEIKITNTGGGAAAMGAVITDVVPAEYNLDPILQEDHENGMIDGVCNDGDADFLCDGTSGSTTLIGAVSDDENKCTVSVDQPDGADKDVDPPLDQRFKEPELLTIDIVAMNNGDMCTVTVYVITDGNPGHVMKVAGVEQCTDAPLNSTGQLAPGTDCNPPDSGEVLLFTLYEPTSCAEVGVIKGTSDPIFDTISLNDGVKVFDGQTGERVSGPEGSLQLTCNFPA